MENQTRFDLNHALENWRQQLEAQPALSTEERRELTDHMHEAITGFQHRGRTDEESFYLAARRVGHPQKLAEEFANADPNRVWRERVFWMAVGLLSVWFWGYLMTETEIVIRTLLGTRYPYKWGLGILIAKNLVAFIGLAILAARGRSAWLVTLETFIFRSRQRFALLTMAPLVVIPFALFYIRKSIVWSLYQSPTPLMLFYQLSYALGWIAIIAWLMPRRTMKTT